jgi:hypothetical protein
MPMKHDDAMTRRRNPAVCEVLDHRRLLAAVTSGQTVTASLAFPGQVQTYDLLVGAGQPIVVAVGETSAQAFAPSVTIRNPSGSVIASGSGAIGTLVRTNATVGGIYRIDVGDVGGNDVGTYRVTAFTTGAQQTDDENAGVIESGRRRPSDIAPGDLDVWYVDSPGGQSLFTTATDNAAGNPANPSAFIFAPNGTLLAEGTNEIGIILESSLSLPGLYYIVVYEGGADETGRYALSNVVISGPQYSGDPDAAPLGVGVTRAGDLPIGDLDAMPITGFAGRTVAASMTATTGNLQPELLLVDDAGTVVGTASGSTTASLNVTAPSDGRYWLVTRDRAATGGGTYNIRYDLIDPTAPTLTDGILTIAGSDDADTIGIWNDGSTLRVRTNGRTYPFLTPAPATTWWTSQPPRSTRTPSAPTATTRCSAGPETTRSPVAPDETACSVASGMTASTAPPDATSSTAKVATTGSTAAPATTSSTAAGTSTDYSVAKETTTSPAGPATTSSTAIPATTPSRAARGTTSSPAETVATSSSATPAPTPSAVSPATTCSSLSTASST